MIKKYRPDLMLVIPLGGLLINFYFFLRLVVQSTPITDEYCFASLAKQIGVWKSFTAWNEIWSPSLGYFPTIWLWSLDVAPLTISQIMTYFSVFCIIATLFLSLRITLGKEGLGFLQYLTAALFLFVVLVINISIIQSSNFDLSFSSIHDSTNSAIGLLQNLFAVERDGQLLRWFFSISLSWQKSIFGSLLLVVMILGNEVIRNQISPFWLTPFGAIFLAYGPNGETIIFLIFLFFISLYLIKMKNTNSLIFLISTIAHYIVFYILMTSRGSLSRRNKFPETTFASVLQNSLNIGYRLLVVILVTGLLTFLFFSLAGNHIPISKNIIGFYSPILMLTSAVFGNFLVGNLVYISTYHRISFVIVTFGFFLILWQRLRLSHPSFFIWNRALILVCFILLSIISANSLKKAAELSRVRNLAFQERLQVGSVNGNNFVQLPMKDNIGYIFAQDLDPNEFAISPIYGWNKGVSLKCYQDVLSAWRNQD